MAGPLYSSPEFMMGSPIMHGPRPPGPDGSDRPITDGQGKPRKPTHQGEHQCSGHNGRCQGTGKAFWSHCCNWQSDGARSQ